MKPSIVGIASNGSASWTSHQHLFFPLNLSWFWPKELCSGSGECKSHWSLMSIAGNSAHNDMHLLFLAKLKLPLCATLLVYPHHFLPTFPLLPPSFFFLPQFPCLLPSLSILLPFKQRRWSKSQTPWQRPGIPTNFQMLTALIPLENLTKQYYNYTAL